MILVTAVFEQIHNALGNEDLLQDSLWYLCFNFHHFSYDERIQILTELTMMAPKQTVQTLFWMLIYLRSAYFSVMRDDEKLLYLKLLCSLPHNQGGYLPAEIFELTGRLFRVAPDIVRPALLQLLVESVSGGSSQAILAFCGACERFAWEVDSHYEELLVKKLNELRQQTNEYYINEAIEHAMNTLNNIGAQQ